MGEESFAAGYSQLFPGMLQRLPISSIPKTRDRDSISVKFTEYAYDHHPLTLHKEWCSNAILRLILSFFLKDFCPYMSTDTPIAVRNLPYQPGTMDEVALRVVQHAAAKGPTHLVIAVNGQVFVLAHQQPKFADVIRRAEEVVLDGISVFLATRALRNSEVHRVQGVELMNRICSVANDYSLRVMLLGGRPGAAEKMKAMLAKSSPNLTVSTYCPPFGFEKSEETLEATRQAIRDFAPDILFAAFGAPKQEYFMDQHIRPLNVPVVMAVGGSFEMISGMVRRAPHWVQAIGMEWLFRTILEPRRLLWRYVYTNTVFIWLFLGEWFSRGK
jgi:N-acetylglucosaminyldiphosphoundecaprenol N-acetyl-beta-D-mannosaminyltransferase